MRRVAFGALLAAFAVLPAMAEMAAIDTDGDGVASFEELAAVYADFNEESFAALDTDQDGALNEEELQAGMESGELDPIGD